MGTGDCGAGQGLSLVTPFFQKKRLKIYIYFRMKCIFVILHLENIDYRNTEHLLAYHFTSAVLRADVSLALAIVGKLHRTLVPMSPIGPYFNDRRILSELRRFELNSVFT